MILEGIIHDLFRKDLAQANWPFKVIWGHINLINLLLTIFNHLQEENKSVHFGSTPTRACLYFQAILSLPREDFTHFPTNQLAILIIVIYIYIFINKYVCVCGTSEQT